MKKIIIGIAAVAVVAGGAFLVVGKKDTAKTTDSASSTSASSEANTNTSTQPAAKTSALKLPAQTVGKEADCSLYTLAELATLWGVPMTDTDINKVIETSDGGKLYSCNYNETDSGMGLAFSIEFREFMSEEKAKTDMANTRDGAKIGDTVYFVQDEQQGVGDEAFFSLPQRQVGNPKNPTEQLYARKGNVVMLLSATNLSGVKADYRDKILQSYKLHLQ